MLEIKNINYQIENKIIFKNINLKVKKENNVVLINGKNGIGKSSLLNVIAGIYLNKDMVIKNNSVIKTLEKYLSYVNEKIFYLPAGNDNLFHRNTVKRNIQYYYYLYNMKDIKIEELEKIEIIKNLLGKKIYELSSGQKKIVELILALLIEKDILILDEPFTFLDEENYEEILERINNYKGKIIMTSHLDKEKLKVKINKKEIRLVEMTVKKNVNYDL